LRITRASAPALGLRFCAAIHGLISEIRASPERFRMIMPPVRRHFRHPFPYAVLYVVRPDCVWIVSVCAFKRDPNHWRERL
jgi:hypothetical protein